MTIRCPMCRASVEVDEGVGEVICPGCGETLEYIVTVELVSVRAASYEAQSELAREWERAVDEGDYGRAEILRRRMEQEMGESAEEEEIPEQGEDNEEEGDLLEPDGDYEDEEDSEPDDDYEDMEEES